LPTLKEILEDEIDVHPAKDGKTMLDEIITRLKISAQEEIQIDADEEEKDQQLSNPTNSSTKPKRSSNEESDHQESQERLFPLTEDFWSIFSQKFSEFNTSNETFGGQVEVPRVNETLTLMQNESTFSGIDDLFRSIMKNEEFRQKVSEAANFATQNHVAILKTYGVEERLDQSGRFSTFISSSRPGPSNA